MLPGTVRGAHAQYLVKNNLRILSYALRLCTHVYEIQSHDIKTQIHNNPLQ